MDEQEVSDGSALGSRAAIRAYVSVRSKDIDGTSYETFQSSNLSLFSTSSKPFTDDEVVRNRNYGADSVEVS